MGREEKSIERHQESLRDCLSLSKRSKITYVTVTKEIFFRILRISEWEEEESKLLSKVCNVK